MNEEIKLLEQFQDDLDEINRDITMRFQKLANKVWEQRRALERKRDAELEAQAKLEEAR